MVRIAPTGAPFALEQEAVARIAGRHAPRPQPREAAQPIAFGPQEKTAREQLGDRAEIGLLDLPPPNRHLPDSGRALAVKVVRFRHLAPGLVTGDVAFPAHEDEEPELRAAVICS